MTFIIPKKLKEEFKIFDNPITIYGKDILYAGIIMGFFVIVGDFVHPWLKIPFWITAIISTIYLILPAKSSNLGKRNWQAIYFMLINSKTTYRSLDYISSQTREEGYDEEER